MRGSFLWTNFHPQCQRVLSFCYVLEPRKVCDPTEFLCVGTDICAQKIWRCDGEDDCGNGYDELNCRKFVMSSDDIKYILFL